jgi:hypothetical protein
MALENVTDQQWTDFLVETQLLHGLRAIFPSVEFHEWFAMPPPDLSLQEEGELLPWLLRVRAQGASDVRVLAHLRSLCGRVSFRCSGRGWTEQRLLDFARRHMV